MNNDQYYKGQEEGNENVLPLKKVVISESTEKENQIEEKIQSIYQILRGLPISTIHRVLRNVRERIEQHSPIN